VTAYEQGQTIELAALDGDGIGAEGLRAVFLVAELARAEPIDEQLRLSAPLKAAPGAVPQWMVADELVGWAHYKQITVRGDSVSDTLTDFPLLVAFQDDPDIGASARADGLDIRFTTADGSQELSFELESFSVQDGLATGRFWVKVPRIEPGSGAVIRI